MPYKFGSSRPEFNMKKPVELGKEYEAEIEDKSRSDDGVTEIEGFVIFVPNTKQGEHVKFKNNTTWKKVRDRQVGTSLI